MVICSMFKLLAAERAAGILFAGYVHHRRNLILRHVAVIIEALLP